jgi:lipopolysaccharide/colanic/teichoic acid biosynthesis glycosyltransferase
MKSERRYRLVTGVVAICAVAFAFLVANHPLSQRLLTSLPPGSQLAPVVLSGDALGRALAIVVVVIVGALVPVFVRPRRVIEVITLTERQVLIGCLCLAAVGYLDYSFRLPRTTFVLLAGLLCLLPAAFAPICSRFLAAANGTIIVGDDAERIAAIRAGTDLPIAGYVSSPTQRDVETDSQRATVPLTDGGLADGGLDDGSSLGDGGLDGEPLAAGTGTDRRPGDLRRLGSTAQLSAVLRKYDVSRAILAFSAPDRTAFFRALAVCYDHGVAVTAHREYADAVLTSGEDSEFVEVDLEPWNWTDYVLKYLFDKTFALVGLSVLTPLMIVIALAIKLEDGGSIFYSQDRTTVFGRTFRLYKFRTMRPGSGDAAPVDDDDNAAITRVGRVLRRTHLDEIPQLYPILLGDMSVVGPRAVWTEEEEQFLDAGNGQWRQRWFVKPGLTGLAQVNDVSSTNPELKLRYDVEYIRRQSFALDATLVVGQIWIVLLDLTASLPAARNAVAWIGDLVGVLPARRDER